METGRYVVVLLILSLVSKSISRPIIQTTPLVPDWISDGVRVGSDGSSYCESWRFSVATNDAEEWTQIPGRCKDYVEQYMTATGSRYQSDSDMVAGDALKFAEKVDFIGHGVDAWVFDIDETLLSNLPYYKDHEFGLEKYDETAFNKWVDKAEATALPASLNFYKEVKKLGFKIFLLTGRDESQRDVTETNLKNEGYTSWDRLILSSEAFRSSKQLQTPLFFDFYFLAQSIYICSISLCICSRIHQASSFSGKICCVFQYSDEDVTYPFDNR